MCTGLISVLLCRKTSIRLLILRQAFFWYWKKISILIASRFHFNPIWVLFAKNWWYVAFWFETSSFLDIVSYKRRKNWRLQYNYKIEPCLGTLKIISRLDGTNFPLGMDRQKYVTTGTMEQKKNFIISWHA